MPNHLKRYFGRGDLHFIIFTCYQHRKFLASARSRSVVVEILGEVRARYGCALVGYVVMPDHVHLLIGEPAGVTPAIVLQVFMHANPVVEGLVRHPLEWPWSSWPAYVGKPTMLAIDFME
jgi:putative transposase